MNSILQLKEFLSCTKSRSSRCLPKEEFQIIESEMPPIWMLNDSQMNPRLEPRPLPFHVPSRLMWSLQLDDPRVPPGQPGPSCSFLSKALWRRRRLLHTGPGHPPRRVLVHVTYTSRNGGRGVIASLLCLQSQRLPVYGSPMPETPSFIASFPAPIESLSQNLSAPLPETSLQHLTLSSQTDLSEAEFRFCHYLVPQT